MDNKNQLLTTAEFASKAGMTTSSVTKLIRAGKIDAEKKSGKWMILPDQLKKLDKTNKTKAAGRKMLTVAEFSGMTYLTEFGVMEWLRQGRLSGRQLAGGEWKVDAANLEKPAVKRLVRE